jgi:hypothetical protein
MPRTCNYIRDEKLLKLIAKPCVSQSTIGWYQDECKQEDMRRVLLVYASATVVSGLNQLKCPELIRPIRLKRMDDQGSS